MRRLARRPDAKSVRVKKSKSTKAGSAPVTKFKVRCSKVRGRSHRTSLTVAQHLHTLIVKESDKADKVRAVSIAIHADSTASPIFAAECVNSPGCAAPDARSVEGRGHRQDSGAEEEGVSGDRRSTARLVPAGAGLSPASDFLHRTGVLLLRLCCVPL